jgi:hypothetical protein
MAGAKLRSELASADAMLLFALRPRSAVDELNRPACLMGKRDPLALSSPRVLFFQTAHSIRAVIWSGRVTRAVHTCAAAVSVLLNPRQRQTRFWLRTGLRSRYLHRQVWTNPDMMQIATRFFGADQVRWVETLAGPTRDAVAEATARTTGRSRESYRFSGHFWRPWKTAISSNRPRRTLYGMT